MFLVDVSDVINKVFEPELLLKSELDLVDVKKMTIDVPRTWRALMMCSGAIVFLFSRVQTSLASEEMRWINSTRK
jgi:hypothetical protein